MPEIRREAERTTVRRKVGGSPGNRNDPVYGIFAGKPVTGQESGRSPKDGADRNEKKQRVTTGTERIPRVETQAAGCFGTYRRIQFEEREGRGVAKHALYRETPRSGRRTNDDFLQCDSHFAAGFPYATTS